MIKSLEMGIQPLCAEVPHTSKGHPRKVLMRSAASRAWSSWPAARLWLATHLPTTLRLTQAYEKVPVLSQPCRRTTRAHAINLAAASPSTQTASLHQGWSLITTWDIKGTDATRLSSPMERAANTLNRGTKMLCRQNSVPWRGVHRGTGSVTEPAIRGQQQCFK